MRNLNVYDATIAYAVLRAKQESKEPSLTGWTTYEECTLFCQLLEQKNGCYLIRDYTDFHNCFSDANHRIVPIVNDETLRFFAVSFLNDECTRMFFYDEELKRDFVLQILKREISTHKEMIERYQARLQELEVETSSTLKRTDPKKVVD